MLRFGSLPEEAITEIMSRLPADTLLLAKCINKTWYGLINSLRNNPNFVMKHLENQKKISSSMGLVFTGFCTVVYSVDELGYKLLFFSLSKLNNQENSEDTYYVIEDLYIPLPKSLQVCGGLVKTRHCNGLFFLTQVLRFSPMALCNPTIKEFKVLPKPHLVHSSFQVAGLGFGYDSKTNDYKVIRFGYDRFNNPKYLRAEVYKLGTDSWREIGTTIDVEIRCVIDCSREEYEKEAYCKGVYYWCLDEPQFSILSFDMSDEVFRIIHLPKDIQSFNLKCITSLNGYIALICSSDEGFSNSIQTWVMDENAGNFSWTKYLVLEPRHLTREPHMDILGPMTFWKSDEKSDELLMEDTNGDLVSYNLHTKKLWNIKLNGAWSLQSAFDYVKSLVSVTRRREQV